MTINVIDDLKTQIKLLQEKVWSNEEKLQAHLECLLKRRSEIHKVQTQVDQMQVQISKITSHAKSRLKGGKK